MGSCEDPVPLPPQNLHDHTELGLTCPKPDPDAADLLLPQFENVALKDSEEDGNLLYPLRPYAQDCQYYVRTGSCKFGLNCRFNHPLTRTPKVFLNFAKSVWWL